MKVGDERWFFDEGYSDVYEGNIVWIDGDNVCLEYDEGRYEAGLNELFETEIEAAIYGLSTKGNELRREIKMAVHDLGVLEKKMLKIIERDDK